MVAKAAFAELAAGRSRPQVHFTGGGDPSDFPGNSSTLPSITLAFSLTSRAANMAWIASIAASI
jgi:hypothetical protein